MAYSSSNPRYVFTKDRLPAVITYSVVTAIVSILGFLTHVMFERAAWLVDVKAHVAGASLYVDYAAFLLKLVAAVAVIYFVALHAKRATQDSFESPNIVARVRDTTFAITMSVMFMLGYVWKSWTEFNGVSGATFFVVLFGLALSLLEIPFRKFSHKIAYLLVILILFLIVQYAAGSADLAASSFSLLPSLLGLVSVAVLTSFVPWFAPYDNQNSKFGSLAMIMIALFVFVGGTIWTVAFSFTSIKILPLFTPGEWWAKFNGLANYTRLFNTTRWMDCPALTKIGQASWQFKCSGSFPNVITYAVLFICLVMVLGFIIAVLMDQKIRAEGVFRTIYLYPFALSFIVTGHVWAWIFSPEYGLQKAVRGMGWESFSFGWIADQQMVMYAIVIAGIWQGTGFVMALMLAGLRGIDEEIWKAAKIDGIPTWRTYLQIVVPMMKPVLVTTFVFVASGAIRIYDLVLAITDGGPGVSSDVPSRYIYQNFTANLGQSLAASTIMLLSMAVILIPWIRLEFGKRRQ
jgi:glucose/mannose transport system permease protein